jgi:hypothetical protein
LVRSLLPFNRNESHTTKLERQEANNSRTKNWYLKKVSCQKNNSHKKDDRLFPVGGDGIRCDTTAKDNDTKWKSHLLVQKEKEHMRLFEENTILGLESVSDV